MMPAKLDPISITTIREKGVNSIVDWFDQHKQWFYTLGRFYLRNQQQVEELFYLSILKVEKEWPQLKSETPFEMWVTSIFIQNCRELSEDGSLQASEESERWQDLFDQLVEYEKEAMVLTYVQGFSHEEAAQLLQVSAEKIKELLFSGIQSFRKDMGYGSTFSGCKEYQKDYIDYLERAMVRSKKIDFEIHIYHCQDCQEDLGTFREVMQTMLNLANKMEDLHMPSGFMENVKARLTEKERQKQQKNKKRKRIGFAFASVFALLVGIGFFTGAFAYLYYSWTEDNPELRAFLQEGLGQRLNLEAESEGVKIKIKSAIADDFQTLVFYEIEDQNADNQYLLNYNDGTYVKNESEMMGRTTYQMHNPPDLKSQENRQEKNVFHGKLNLLPLTKDKGTIKLRITKLQKLTRDSSAFNGFRIDETIENKSGEWNFEIPVTKQPSIEYKLDGKAIVEGVPVRFDKLTTAPTMTILHFGVYNQQEKKRIEFLDFSQLEVNNKKMKPVMYGSNIMDSQQDMNWTTFQTRFDPLFEEKLKAVNVQLKSAHLTVEDKCIIELDKIKEYPHTFEYVGSTISIDKLKVGQPTEMVISNHEIRNRAYGQLQFNFVGEDEEVPLPMEVNSEGVLVDKNGVKYDMNDPTISYEELEQPRYFFTVQNIRIQDNHVIPKKFVIYGYNTTKYLDDVVNISLKNNK